MTRRDKLQICMGNLHMYYHVSQLTLTDAQTPRRFASRYCAFTGAGARARAGCALGGGSRAAFRSGRRGLQAGIRRGGAPGAGRRCRAHGEQHGDGHWADAARGDAVDAGHVRGRHRAALSGQPGLHSLAQRAQPARQPWPLQAAAADGPCTELRDAGAVGHARRASAHPARRTVPARPGTRRCGDRPRSPDSGRLRPARRLRAACSAFSAATSATTWPPAWPTCWATNASTSSRRCLPTSLSDESIVAAKKLVNAQWRALMAVIVPELEALVEADREAKQRNRTHRARPPIARRPVLVRRTKSRGKMTRRIKMSDSLGPALQRREWLLAALAALGGCGGGVEQRRHRYGQCAADAGGGADHRLRLDHRQWRSLRRVRGHDRRRRRPHARQRAIEARHAGHGAGLGDHEHRQRRVECDSQRGRGAQRASSAPSRRSTARLRS